MATPTEAKKPGGLAPAQALFHMMAGHYLSRAIYVAAKLGISDLLRDGPRTSAELAKGTGMHAPSLHRMLRYLASAGVFAEGEDGSFQLTAVGEWLRSDIPGSRRALALLIAGPLQYRAWSELEYSVQTGGVAFDRAFGMGAFQYFGEHPEEAAIFNEAMTGATTQAAAAVAAAYDFSSFRKIVDVGGGHAVLLAAILKANPGLHGVLFELAQATEGARKRLEAAGVAVRSEVVAGDFFQGVPAGADAYILKSVIHDWDDERSVAILKNCHRAMAPHGKLLLVEIVVPARMEPSPVSQITAGSDINMMVNVGGRERTDAEFRALLDAAGFRLTRIIPTEVITSIIEAVRKE